MITLDALFENKESLDDLAKNLTKEDIKFLIELLNEKNDEIRYAAFLTLKSRSKLQNDVYDYFEVFEKKLICENSYQRSLGIKLLAENVRWDKENKFDDVIDAYLVHTDDEKFITARQTIQSINEWIAFKQDLFSTVINKLLSIDIQKRKDSQRKLLLMDILTVLSTIDKIEHFDKITKYVTTALTGGILDAKSIKQVKNMFD